jgi:YjbE family integral membrane protein
MDQIFSLPILIAFVQVILIDIALAADNAVVVGMAASGLQGPDRRRAILIGIIAATVLRIAFASVAVQLLQLTGLVLAGGILLLWVCWKMWRELHPEGLRALLGLRNGATTGGTAQDREPPAPKTLRQAVVTIIVADVSMSLDNVLAVAGAGREHPWVVVFGLMLSVLLMGAAAMMIARLLERHRWIAYLGLAVVLFVALRMIWEGSHQLAAAAA